MMKADVIHKFVGDQLSRWPLACGNFRALKNVRVKEMDLCGLRVKLQFNPARMISSAARLSKEEIAARRCFLCHENRPADQIFIRFDGRKSKKYHILVNPYPIFPDHLVIAMSTHVEQSIWNRYVDMLDMARKYRGYTFFYNGPHSGASAPDHHHFQAAPSGLIPLANDVNALLDAPDRSPEVLRHLSSICDADVYHYERFTTGVFVIRSRTVKSAAKLFYRLADCADCPEGEPEPLLNLFSYFHDGEFRSIVVFRSRHRSHHYFSDGPDHLTMSPGCADMGGVFIVPVEKEFDDITVDLLSEMVREVSITEDAQADIIRRITAVQPSVTVGIMSADAITFEILSDGAGPRRAAYLEGKILYDGALYDELYFDAQTPSTYFAEPSFVLHDVVIGKNFHWERKENQQFAGALKIIADGGRLTAMNVVGVEDYLLSVISSEMSAASSEEFLKAHAVISRSWVMARMTASDMGRSCPVPEGVNDMPSVVSYIDTLLNGGIRKAASGVHEYVKWYDHEEHVRFDVCADDHCQRYQGLTRATGATVRKVIDATWGQVLCHEGRLCDARFSKCCGGRMERFSSCWDDVDPPYLQPLADAPGHEADGKCFCDTQDSAVLGQILNDYDRETIDFFKWTVECDRDTLSERIADRSGIDIGRVKAITPLERGESGRIVKLEIVGDKGKLVVGKELEIRRILSETHLKSSCFEVEYINDESGDWIAVRLHGRGWGHGVGLCQIGAAVMASEGYGYKAILEHYYPGTECVRIGGEKI